MYSDSYHTNTSLKVCLAANVTITVPINSNSVCFNIMSQWLGTLCNAMQYHS